MKKKVERIREKVEVLKGPPRSFDHHRLKVTKVPKRSFDHHRLKVTKVPKKEEKKRVRRIRYYKGD